MLAEPESISSAYPLSSPYFFDLARNIGRTFVERYRVKSIDTGTVRTKMSIIGLEIFHIKMSEPTTVYILVITCTRSFESEVFTVSTSYDKWLMISPVALLSKYPTGSVLSFSNNCLRIM